MLAPLHPSLKFHSAFNQLCRKLINNCSLFIQREETENSGHPEKTVKDAIVVRILFCFGQAVQHEDLSTSPTRD